MSLDSYAFPVNLAIAFCINFSSLLKYYFVRVV